MKSSIEQAIAFHEISAGGQGSGRHASGFTSQQFDVRKFKNGADAYKAGHAHILDQINRMKAMLEANPPTGKESWGHAGTVSDVSKHLADLHNSMAGTGEYSTSYKGEPLNGWLGSK